MRIAVISDLHANWAALRALPGTYDAILCTGDLVDYGAEPEPVLRFVREHVFAVVQGNHDYAAGTDDDCRCSSLFKPASVATRRGMRQVLSSADLSWLAGLPTSAQVTLGGQRIALFHATPRDPRFRYLLSTAPASEWERELESIDADLVLLGHTHRPVVFGVGRTTVANAGSLGLPTDGDPRASFAVIQDGEVRLQRFEYAVEEAIRAVDAAFDPPTATFLSRVLRTGRAPSWSGTTWRRGSDRSRRCTTGRSVTSRHVGL
jgi:putative phosphoesterase